MSDQSETPDLPSAVPDTSGETPPSGPSDPTGPADLPDVYPGDVEAAATTVRVLPPVNEKGRLLLHGGCLTFAGIVFAAVVAGTLAGVGGAYLMLHGVLPGGTSEIRVVGQTTQEPVASAAAAALPSIVNIDVSASETTSSGRLPSGHPSVPVVGTGSGVAFKEAPGGGTYIITNEHVITDATRITVTPAGGEPVNGEVVGADVDTDIAVVRVPVRLPLLRVGDSDALVIGQLVIAIGSPYGLEHSVSSGVVSGTHRSLPESAGDNTTGAYPLVDVIQTDAAINPGNSGGALIDRGGRLVGINSAIYSESGANAGVGFAVPAKTAVRIADELIATGKARHPFLGIVGQTITETLAKEKGLPVTDGTYVVEVTKNTGAAKAGIKAGDAIVALDGVPIRSMDDLLVEVRGKSIDQKVKVELYRSGKKITVEMTVGDKPKLEAPRRVVPRPTYEKESPMVQGYRCKGCGYYHVGPAPEVCPVCGAPQSAFLPYDGPGDLAGTKTLENLKAAFAGESQANRRYTLFSRVAGIEGAGSAVAAFDHAAAEETAHALGHLAYMGAVGTTSDNLRAAIEGEGYETVSMYPDYAAQAEADGFPEIAHYFRAVGGYEAKHKSQYEAALNDIEGQS